MHRAVCTRTCPCTETHQHIHTDTQMYSSKETTGSRRLQEGTWVTPAKPEQTGWIKSGYTPSACLCLFPPCPTAHQSSCHNMRSSVYTGTRCIRWMGICFVYNRKSYGRKENLWLVLCGSGLVNITVSLVGQISGFLSDWGYSAWCWSCLRRSLQQFLFFHENMRL